MLRLNQYKPYTIISDGLFIPNPTERIAFLLLPENVSSIEMYNRIQISPLICKQRLCTPRLNIPGSGYIRPDFKQYHDATGIMPFFQLDLVNRFRRPVVYDIGYIIDAVMYKRQIHNYMGRGDQYFRQLYYQLVNLPPSNYKRVLLYYVDLDKTDLLSNSIQSYKMYSILRLLREKKPLNVNDIFLIAKKNGKCRWTLMYRDGNYTLSRFINVFRTLVNTSKPHFQVDEKELEEPNTLTINSDQIPQGVDKQLAKAFELDSSETIPIKDLAGIAGREMNTDDETRAKIVSAVSSYITNDEEQKNSLSKAIKNNSPEDTGEIVKQAILKNITRFPEDKSNKIARTSSKEQAIDLAKEYLITTKLSDPKSEAQIFKLNNPVDILQTPPEIYLRRREEFNQISERIRKVFSLLASKPLKLFIKDLYIERVTPSVTELNYDKLLMVHVILLDEFKRTHHVKFTMPELIDNNYFFMGGQKKIFISQLIPTPITKTKPDLVRIYTNYSTLNLTRKVRGKLPFVEVFIGGKKLTPLSIILVGNNFKDIFKILNIKYAISDKKLKDTIYNIQLVKKPSDEIPEQKIYLNLYPETLLQKTLVNGLIVDKAKYTWIYNTEDDLSEGFRNLIVSKYDNRRVLYVLDEILSNIIDVQTREILVSLNLPTNIYDLLLYGVKLLDPTVPTIAPTDLNYTRLRSTEIIIALLEKIIQAAYNEYRTRAKAGDVQARFVIRDSALLSALHKSGLFTSAENINPVEELALASRLKITGPGGADASNATLDQRNLHSTHFGQIDPIDVQEGGGVGTTIYAANSMINKNLLGIFDTSRGKLPGSGGSLGISTSLVPFIGADDSARILMAANQLKQTVPLVEAEPPIVQTGYESYLGNLATSSFSKKASNNGIITEVNNDYISVSYGKIKEDISLEPELLVSGNGIKTFSEFKPLVRVGQKVKRGDILASSSQIQDGGLTLGRNVLVAMMPWFGYNYEDGIVISEELSPKFSSSHCEIEEIFIAEDETVDLLNIQLGKLYRNGDILIRKLYKSGSIGSGLKQDIEAPDGVLVDLELVSTKEPSEPHLIELVKNSKSYYMKKFSKKQGLMPARKIIISPQATIKGELIKGTYIKLTFSYTSSLGMGDKLANRHGNKGIVSKVLPPEKMPILPDGRRIQMVLNPMSIIGRKNLGQVYELYYGLILDATARNILKMTDRKKIINYILSVISLLDVTEKKTVYKQWSVSLRTMSDSDFKKLIIEIKNKNLRFIVPAFGNISPQKIKEALKFVGEDTGYILSIPGIGKTHEKVVCGFMYILKLEHLAEVKMHARSTGAVSAKTKQPVSGKKMGGGGKIGEHDIWALAASDCNGIIKEMFRAKSDDQTAKRNISTKIIHDGSARLSDMGSASSISNPTVELLKQYFEGMHLSVQG